MNRMSLDNNCKITIIETLADWSGMSKEWNDLLGQSSSNTIFLTWEWLVAWTETFLGSDRKLFILAVYEGNQFIGAAPWCIRHVKYFGCSMRIIEFLGIPEAASDYLDVFAKRGKEKEVAHQIYHFLQRATSVWDSMALRDIPSDSLFLLHFMNKMNEEGKHTELGSGPYSPSVSLPQTADVFMAQLSSNRRQQYSRHLRILRRSGEVTHRIHLSGDVSAVLKEFYRLYEQKWGDAKQLFRFLEMFIVRSEGKGLIQLDLLNVGGRDIAGLLHLRYDNTLLMYLMGVDHSFDRGISIGNIVVGLSIEKAIAAGFSRYDFLRGDEDYKFHWANDGKRAVRFSHYGKKAVPLMCMTEQYVKSIVKVLTR